MGSFRHPYYSTARQRQVEQASAARVYRETVDQFRARRINRDLAAFRLGEAGYFAAEIAEALS
jgi:hypothetical protein